jgi:ABC-2 type transport system ATP-binding protein
MGRTPWKQRREHVARIGVVFGQKSQLWWDTPAIDSFELLRDIYKVPQSDYKRRLSELTERLNAGSILKTPVRQMSLGQRMKCELIASLLHGPEILFLDEPTIGLDAVTRIAVRDFLTELNRKEGVTMILTTHDMDDIEALCSRVMVIGHGKLLFDGGMDSLRKTYAPNRLLKIRLGADMAVGSIEGAESVNQNGRDVVIAFRPEKISAQEMIARAAQRLQISDLTVESPDVEQMIADMYRELKL